MVAEPATVPEVKEVPEALDQEIQAIPEVQMVQEVALEVQVTVQEDKAQTYLLFQQLTILLLLTLMQLKEMPLILLIK